MTIVSTYDAKSHLSALLEKVTREHEEIVITRHGKPIAKLVEFTEDPWVPCFDPLPPGLRVTCSPEEAIAPVYPDGIPWSKTDPV